MQCMYQPVRIGGWRRYEALIKRDVNNPYSPVTGEAGWPGPAQSDPHHQCVCTWRAKQALHMQGERFFLPLTTCALGWLVVVCIITFFPSLLLRLRFLPRGVGYAWRRASLPQKERVSFWCLRYGETMPVVVPTFSFIMDTANEWDRVTTGRTLPSSDCADCNTNEIKQSIERYAGKSHQCLL